MSGHCIGGKTKKMVDHSLRAFSNVLLCGRTDGAKRGAREIDLKLTGLFTDRVLTKLRYLLRETLLP